MILESNEATKKYGGKTAVDHVSLKLESGLVYYYQWIRGTCRKCTACQCSSYSEGSF